MIIHFLDDDHSTNRYHEITLTDVAEEQNCKLEFNDHPISLLEKYENEGGLPDLLFLDINMPMIDGWGFLESFNEKFTEAKTTFVVLTTANNQNIFEKAKTYHNIKSVARKPLSPENLQDLVKEIFAV